jgi:hypothetical protein
MRKEVLLMTATRTKVTLAAMAAKPLAKKQGALRMLAKRRARRRAERLGRAARGAVTVLSGFAPQTARALGIIERPKRKPVAPWIATGVALGASAIYFFEPGQGPARRKLLTRLVR